MKLLFAFAAILAVSLAAPGKQEDSEAPLPEWKDLKAEANSYQPQAYPTWGHPNKPVTWAPPYTTQNPWTIPHHHVTTTAAPAVIKNEQHFYDNGAYKYEYQIADGTWVGEEGYFTSPNREPESLVKKGWYSYVGPDGKTYTVTYYADWTGYHPYGAHLPNNNYVAPVPYSSEGEKEVKDYKPIHDHEHEHDYYTTKAPEHTYYPTQTPGYIPPQQPTYPPQQPTYPPQQSTYPPNHIDHYPSPQPPHHYHYSK